MQPSCDVDGHLSSGSPEGRLRGEVPSQGKWDSDAVANVLGSFRRDPSDKVFRNPCLNFGPIWRGDTGSGGKRICSPAWTVTAIDGKCLSAGHHRLCRAIQCGLLSDTYGQAKTRRPKTYGKRSIFGICGKSLY